MSIEGGSRPSKQDNKDAAGGGDGKRQQKWSQAEPMKKGNVTDILEAPEKGDTERFRMSALVRAGGLAPTATPAPDLPPPDLPPPDLPPPAPPAPPAPNKASSSGVFSELEDLDAPSDNKRNTTQLPAPISGAPAPPPPPSVKGLPPPPPPPPGGKGMGGLRPTKPVMKPLTKMKPLHWTRILLQPREMPTRRPMIWDGVSEVDFDQGDFELNFAVKAREGHDDPDKKKDLAAAAKASAVRVLTVKRSNTIAVMCSKLPDTDTLIQAIRNLDSAVLERQFVRALGQNMANAEELQQIREMQLPDITLDKPEQ